MTNRKKIKSLLLLSSIVLIIALVSFSSFYTYWTFASPSKTCASCHEIGSSVNTHSLSAHRNFPCKECHGTALSNGWHSMKEKGMMVFHHIRSGPEVKVQLKEKQQMEVIKNCAECHQFEYTNWLAGGHSIDYAHVFLNGKHDSTEQINFDCLRCHGMFHEESVDAVVEPLNITGPWKLKDETLASMPAIPCMACHQIHQEGSPLSRPDYANPRMISYSKKDTVSVLGFYDRREKAFFPVEELPALTLWEGNRKVKISDDPEMRNCVQCHAPNAMHQAGTSDDRTPRGVHEGLSCNACHEAHNNNARKSCGNCHPAISNCKLDVTKMNTTFVDMKSPNNIHFVACMDCHKDGKHRSQRESAQSTIE